MKPYFEQALENIITNNVSVDRFTIDCLKNYPQYLYKYRTCSKEYNFEMVEQEYLWADFPENFDDPLDSLVNLKLPSEVPAIQKWIWNHLGEIVYYSIPPKGMPPHKRGQTLKKYAADQTQFLDSKGRYNAKRAERVMLTELKKLTADKQQEIHKLYSFIESPEFEDQVQKAVHETLSGVVNSFRTNNRVCCLTARNDNRKMWEEYSDKYRGFVIEYDLSKLNEIQNPGYLAEVLLHTFPVSYYKRMPKVELLPFIQKGFYKHLYEKEIDITLTEKKLYKQLLNKNYDYRAEEEWRILSSTDKISFPLISAIYAGNKICPENLERLKGYCLEKNIMLYKQSFCEFSGEMQFDEFL